MEERLEENQEPKKKKARGFAAMSPEKQKEIASKGGKQAHSKGKAHQFSKEEAQAAGRKGGQKVSTDKEHMAEIGRKGGKARKQTDDSA